MYTYDIDKQGAKVLQIIDNFVSNGYANRLENMCRTEVCWDFEENISGVHEKTSPNYKHYIAPGADFDGPQYAFAHVALDHKGNKSEFFDQIFPLMYALEEKTQMPINEIYRIRLALNTSVGKEVQHLPHVDVDQPHKVLLYYVNDSDGDTFMYNEMYSPDNHDSLSTFTLNQRVKPKKNRAIVFDGLRYHNSSKPVNYTSRYIINIDFN